MKKNFFYYLLPSVVTGIVSIFIIVPVSTYYLNPEDFGVVAIITFFSALLVPLSSTGVVWVLGGNYYKISFRERKELIFNLFFLSMLLRTFWLIVFASAGIVLLPKLIKSYENYFLSFFWILVTAEWFNGCWELASYTIILQRKAKLHAVLELIRLFTHVGVLLLCLVVFRLKAVSLVLAYLGMAVGGFIFSFIYIKKYIVMRLQIRWLKEIVRRGLPTIPLNLFEVISNSIGRLFIERWIGLAQLGIYSHSQDYKKMFMLGHRAFSKSYSPEVIQAISEKDVIQLKKTKAILKGWFGLLTIMGIGITLFSKNFINILTHGKFVAAAPLVSLWFILVIIYGFGIPYTNFLLVNKKTKFIFYSNIILSVISWIAIALFIKFFGVIGSIVAVIFYFFTLHFVRKIYAIKLGCTNFEEKNIITALTLLVPLLYLTTTFTLSLSVKILIILLTFPIVIKCYGLLSLLLSIKFIRNINDNLNNVTFRLFRKSCVTLREPIFIWGTGRSGTHLLFDILSLHPELCSLKEKKRWKKGLWGDMHYGESTPKKLKKYWPPVEGMRAIWEPAGIVPKFHGVLRRENIDKLQKEIVIDNYMRLSTQWKWNKQNKIFRILDKAPNYIMMVEIINELFPDAYHIFCLRDPRAVVNSILRIMRFTTKYTSNKEYADGFFANMYPDGFENYIGKSLVEILCWQIEHLISIGFSYRNLLGERLVIFRYEELLCSAHEVIKDLYGKLKLSCFEEISELIPNSFPDYSPKWPSKDEKFSPTFDIAFGSDEITYFENIKKLSQSLGYDINNVGSIVCPITLRPGETHVAV